MKLKIFYELIKKYPKLHDISPLFNLYEITYDNYTRRSFDNREFVTLQNIYTAIIKKHENALKKTLEHEEQFEVIKNMEATEALALAEAQFIAPSLTEQAGNFLTSMKNFASSGFKATTAEQLETRKAICNDCKFFDPSGFGGLGKCRKCGCSAYKLNIAASVCPMGYWGSVE